MLAAQKEVMPTSRVARVALLVTTVSCASPPSDVQVPAGEPRARFGVDGVGPIPIIAELDDGVTGLNGLAWSEIEPSAPDGGVHDYRTGSVAVLDLLAAHGRAAQVNLRLDSEWAIEVTECDPDQPYSETNVCRLDPYDGTFKGALLRIKPEHLADWESLISTVVTNYDIPYLQIGSEAENAWYDVDGFVQAVCAAQQAAKRSRPDVVIMAGGFNLGNFLARPEAEREMELEHNQMLRHKYEFARDFIARAKGCYDVLAIHPGERRSIEATLAWYRSQMSAAGYLNAVWFDDMLSGPEKNELDASLYAALELDESWAVTEYGRLQAAELVKKSVVAFTAGIDRLFISSASDWSTYYIPIWRYQGLVRTDDVRKPSFFAAKAMISKLDDFTMAEKRGDAIHAFHFADRPSVHVVWGDAGTTVDLSPYVSTQRVVVTRIATELDDLDNPITPPEEIVATAAVPLAGEPAFVEPYAEGAP